MQVDQPLVPLPLSRWLPAKYAGAPRGGGRVFPEAAAGFVQPRLSDQPPNQAAW